MRIFAIVALTVCQFTAIPFLAIVSANSARVDTASQQVTQNVTTIYKSATM